MVWPFRQHPHSDAAPGPPREWLVQQAPELHAAPLHMLLLVSHADVLQDLTQQLVWQLKQLQRPFRGGHCSAVLMVAPQQHKYGNTI
jgi:hypothetical protein